MVKIGTPSDDELEHLASKLGDAWKKLGRRLKIQEKLDELRKLKRISPKRDIKCSGIGRR